MADFFVVMSTMPTETVASEIARAVVSERLAACANIIPAMRSIYLWKGDIHDDPECLALFKTSSDRLQSLIERIRSIHPYDVPEIIALPIDSGHPGYFSWIEDCVTS